MRERALAGAFAIMLAACTTEAQATCIVFVDTWTDYEARCDTDPFLTVPPGSQAHHDEVEETYFGPDGCASATLDDFRDARALREDCPSELEAWPCEQPGIPDSCADQILR